MRPGQHNKRGRGRNRRHNGGGGSGGGGGGGNPINRVYESNGPDVKVRGTAMTVADKYLQLGRDAHASGDIVMAESYYQHAEHYLRIVAAAQAYNQQMQQQYKRPDDEFGDDDEGDGGEGEETGEGGTERSFSGDPSEQPLIEGFEAPASQERRDFQNRDNNRDNRDNQFGRDRNRDRHRPRWDNRRDRDNQDQPRNPPRGEEPVTAQVQPQPEQQAREPVNGAGDAWGDGPQPSFLKRPSGGKPRGERRPKREVAESTEGSETASADDTPAES